VVLVWIINTFVLTGSVKITGEVASFLVGYFVPEPV